VRRIHLFLRVLLEKAADAIAVMNNLLVPTVRRSVPTGRVGIAALILTVSRAASATITMAVMIAVMVPRSV
jgi:hypothetical protein